MSEILNITAADLKDKIEFSGTRIVFGDDPGFDFPAYAALENGKYKIFINERFGPFTEEQIKTILLHESYHIIRGDCDLVSRKIKEKDMEFSSELFNVAADLVINRWPLDIDVIRSLNALVYEDFILNENFRDTPRPELGAFVIYEYLKRKNKNKNNNPGMQSPSDIRADGSEPDMMARYDLFDSLNKHFVIGKRVDKNYDKNMELYVPDSRLVAFIKALAQLRSSYGGVRTRIRSYVRPGRTPLTRGVYIRDTLRIGVFFDVSGSMRDLIPVLMGALNHMKNEFSAICYEWDTSCSKVVGNKFSKTGGTDPSCIIPPMKAERFDCVIVMSDGEFDREDSVKVNNAAKEVGTELVWVVKRDEHVSKSDGKHVSVIKW
ncbi:MAG: hypothetical protein RMJ82_07780 [Gemmatales bacterium]|nr:hypothetical protein [Gemmatales bacterium]